MSTEIVKLLITGPVNAGKTTLIQHISDTPVISTDEVATDKVAQVKKHTTVAMDFGVLHVDNQLHLHLYGTPGQRRFDFMWDVLAIGAAGIIFLTDATDRESIREMDHIFKYFRKKIRLPSVIGITKLDLPGAIPPLEVAQAIGNEEVPILECDPRNKEESKMLVLSLFEQIAQEESSYDKNDFF